MRPQINSARAFKLLVAAESDMPSEVFDEFASKIKAVTDQHEDEVLAILGRDRLERAKALREECNREVWTKFAVGVGLTGL